MAPLRASSRRSSLQRQLETTRFALVVYIVMNGINISAVSRSQEKPKSSGWEGLVTENVGYIPHEIAIFHRDNDQQNHWV